MIEIEVNSATLLVVGALATLAVFGLALVAKANLKMALPASSNMVSQDDQTSSKKIPGLRNLAGLELQIQSPLHLEAQDLSARSATSATAQRTPTIAYDLSVSPGKQYTFPTVRKGSMGNDLLNEIEKANYLKSQKSDQEEGHYIPPSGFRMFGSRKSTDVLFNENTPTLARKKSRIDHLTEALGDRKKSIDNLVGQSVKREGSVIKLEMLNTDLPQTDADEGENMTQPKSSKEKALKILGGLDLPPSATKPKSPTHSANSLAKVKSPIHSDPSDQDVNDGTQIDTSIPSKALKFFGADPKPVTLETSFISGPSNFAHTEHIPENTKFLSTKHETHLNPTNEEHRSQEVTGDRKPVTPLGDYGFNVNSFAIALNQASVSDAAHAIGKLKVSQAVNTLQCMGPEKEFAILDHIPLSDFKTELLRELSIREPERFSTPPTIPKQSSLTSISKPIGAPVKNLNGFDPSSLAVVMESLPIATALSTLQNLTANQAAETLHNLSAEKRTQLIQQLSSNDFKEEVTAAIEKHKMLWSVQLDFDYSLGFDKDDIIKE